MEFIGMLECLKKGDIPQTVAPERHELVRFIIIIIIISYFNLS